MGLFVAELIRACPPQAWFRHARGEGDKGMEGSFEGSAWSLEGRQCHAASARHADSETDRLHFHRAISSLMFVPCARNTKVFRYGMRLPCSGIR